MSQKIKKLIIRIIALFVSTALASIGAASLVGQNAAIGAAIAGILAISKVAKDLADAIVEDGELSQADIDKAFNDVKKSEK